MPRYSDETWQKAIEKIKYLNPTGANGLLQDLTNPANPSSGFIRGAADVASAGFGPIIAGLIYPGEFDEQIESALTHPKATAAGAASVMAAVPAIRALTTARKVISKPYDPSFGMRRTSDYSGLESQVGPVGKINQEQAGNLSPIERLRAWIEESDKLKGK